MVLKTIPPPIRERYTNAEEVPTSIGGIASGTTFTNQTMEQMWTALLYPYQAPTFSAFTIQSQNNIIEVGDSIAANRTFTWNTTNSGNIQANSISILDITGSATIASGLANTGSYASTYPSITKTAPVQHQFRIQATNTQTDTFTRNYNVNWRWRRFHGTSTNTSLNESQIQALATQVLTNTFVGTYSFAAGGFKYIAYPSSFGTATEFKDQSTNLDVPFEAPTTISITNGFGQETEYRVHRTTNQLGSAINIVVS